MSGTGAATHLLPSMPNHQNFSLVTYLFANDAEAEARQSLRAQDKVGPQAIPVQICEELVQGLVAAIWTANTLSWQMHSAAETLPEAKPRET